MCMWTLCDNTYNLVQAERTFAASIIICQDAGIAIETYIVDLHLGTCDWCEDVLFFYKDDLQGDEEPIHEFNRTNTS